MLCKQIQLEIRLCKLAISTTFRSRGSQSSDESLSNEHFHLYIFYDIFVKVLSMEWRDSADELVSKLDLVQAISNHVGCVVDLHNSGLI